MRMSKLIKFSKLSRNERMQLIQAILILPVIHIALLTLGYSRLQEMLVKLTQLKLNRNSQSEAENLRRARDISGIVSIAAQHGFFRATCLRRSILIWWLLLREGISSRICFGTRIVNHQLEAHAWVELLGVVINDLTQIRQHYFVLEDELPSIHTGL
jgi:hypothetical protein